MYSYYQSNQVAGQTGSASTSATTTGVWNGRQWILTSAPSPAVYKHGKTHHELVSHYTTYYHLWNAQAEEARQMLPRLAVTATVDRAEVERREKWAAYYAANSAALAHFHLSCSRGGPEPYARPVSPPAPPPTATAVDARLASVAAPGVKLAEREKPTAVVGTGTVAKQSGVTAVVVQPEREKIMATHSSAVSVAASNGRKVQLEASASPTPLTSSNNAASQQQVESSSPSREEEKCSKKSRWAKSLQSQSKNGKSEDYDAPTLENNSKNVLYLNKFVGEKCTFDDAKSIDTVESAGTKRKMVDRNSSTLSSTNSSYYGPPSQTDVSSTNEIDSVRSLLDKPLGSSKKKKKDIKPSLVGFEQSNMVMTNRANRFQGKGGIDDVSNVSSMVANFDKYMGKTIIGGSNRQLDEQDYEHMTVKGTCQILEKEYLRLTAPPRPELVRPQSVLEKHLAQLKKSWKKGRKHGDKVRDYNWYCSQFKALRQDLTVQRIFNAFAVTVYETHAKIALEEDDINEYNQSQTQLKELYDSIQGHESQPENRGALKNRNEFIAYRIIYYVFLSCNKKYDGGSSDIFKIMLQLTAEQRKDACIHHALLVRAAVAENDYHKFFLLQDTAPNMGDLLMDKIVPSIRQCALQRICKAYRPSVPTKFVLKELGFDPKNELDAKTGKVWMKSCGCIFHGDSLNTKDTILTESSLGVKNSLI